MIENIQSEIKPVINTNSLSQENILGLINGDIACVRVPDYFAFSEQVVDKIINHPNLGCFGIAKKVGRLGMTHIEITNEEQNNLYHKEALANTKQSREVFSPYLSPIDKLRAELEELWPSGAYLETLEGRKCFAGVCRVLSPSTEVKPHFDRIDRDTPNSKDAKRVITQLSACVYLQVPDEGGELRLWMKETNPHQQDVIPEQGQAIYGVDDDIGEPVHEIKPKVGELLLFNVRRYHGVAAGKGKDRVNTGLFIGYRGMNLPLTYWS